MIWLERKEGALWAVGRAVNPRRLDHLPHVDAHGGVDGLQLVHEGDVDRPEDVFRELHRLRRVRRGHRDDRHAERQAGHEGRGDAAHLGSDDLVNAGHACSGEAVGKGPTHLEGELGLEAVVDETVNFEDAAA